MAVITHVFMLFFRFVFLSTVNSTKYIQLPDMPETFPSEIHLRNCMLFLFHANSSAAAATKYICDVYGDVLDVRKCQRWFRKFKSGDFGLKNEPVFGRPCTFDLESMKIEIENNPKLSIEELSNKIGASWSSTQRYIRKIGKIKKDGEWVSLAPNKRKKKNKH